MRAASKATSPTFAVYLDSLEYLQPADLPYLKPTALRSLFQPSLLCLRHSCCFFLACPAYQRPTGACWTAAALPTPACALYLYLRLATEVSLLSTIENQGCGLPSLLTVPYQLFAPCTTCLRPNKPCL
ncbi:hypothetical protein O6H91_Y376500 [Diphasiastrum complanatum]|nr:hypothetical protein O6H91_Y376500 [Diphasiastrum complanatum]